MTFQIKKCLKKGRFEHSGPPPPRLYNQVLKYESFGQ